jgi:hypothetical protein
MEVLQEYNLYIDYLPGKQTVVADALSRRPDFLTAITTTHTLGDLLSTVKAAYGKDAESKTILESITNGTATDLKLENGLITHQPATGDQQLYIPSDQDLRQLILREYHDSNLAGHLGMDKTYECLARNYWWPTMRNDVREYVRTCPSCQANKGANRKPIGLLHPLPIPERKWECVSTDLIVQLPKTKNGYDAIATFVDKLTKMAHFVPTTTTVDAPKYAQVYFDNVVRHHGLQRSIVSDRDPRFTSKFWDNLMRLCGTNLARSTAYRPQTDGQTERAHRTIEEILRAYVNDKHTDWDERLTAAEFAYNNAPSASSGKSPFYLNYGFHPLTPATLDLAALKTNSNQGATDFLARLDQDLAEERQQLKLAQERQERFANLKRRDYTFQVGSNVMLSTENLRNRLGGSPKFTAKWFGPFKIIEVVSPLAYKLELPPTLKIHPVIHAAYLKPYHESQVFRGRQPTRPPPIDGEDVYLAERLLDKRIIKRGRTTRIEYLVKWSGYPIYEATWEPAENLLGTGTKKMLEDFDRFWTPPQSSRRRN